MFAVLVAIMLGVHESQMAELNSTGDTWLSHLTHACGGFSLKILPRESNLKISYQFDIFCLSCHFCHPVGQSDQFGSRFQQ